jgi:polysaccharide biosynthesis/export protein
MTAITTRARVPLALCLVALLAACSAPRSAGLQSEVLAAATAAERDAPETATAADEAALAGFAVEEVTRDSLARLADWPAVGARGYDWIRRQEQPASLLIAPGDTVTVTVWDAGENSLLAGPGSRVAQLQPMQVSSAGEVFLPFIGTIRISGMSQSSARERIEERYAETIPSAQVQLAVEPGRANTASLVAGVAAPGVYPLVDRDVTLLALLSLGGGVNPGLTNPQVRLFRGDQVFGISVARLYEDPGLDTTLEGGDRVIVEAEDRFFLSLGATGSEARHLFPQDRISAIEALSVVGGVTDDRADPQGILILRRYPEDSLRRDGSGPPVRRVVFTIDLTSADGLFSAGEFRIMPGDLVYATESPVTAARSILGLLGSALGIAGQL